MADIYTRTSLLLGEVGVEKLKNSKVLLFGVGGVGGNCAEALVRAGIGALTIVDGDVYSESNLNRQNFSAVDTVGKSKVKCAAAELARINPNCRITPLDMFYLPDNSSQIDFSVYDYVIDAVDTVSAKIEIIRRAKQCGVRVISSMGAGNKTDPTRFEVADIYGTSVCPLAKIMRKLCRENGINDLKTVYSKEEPRDISANIGEEDIEEGKKTVGSLSFVPSVVGLIIAGEVILDISGGRKGN